MEFMSDPRSHIAEVRDEVWYAKGLRFGCTRCCRCCTGPPGYVWVTREEMVRIADLLSLSVSEFASEYCRRVWWRVSLQERRNGDCIFLTPEGCRIYSTRPSQCRTFPFWEQNLHNSECWEGLKGRCPGIGRGKLYSRNEIECIAARRRST